MMDPHDKMEACPCDGKHPTVCLQCGNTGHRYKTPKEP